MGGKTSSAVKRKWNNNNYDRIEINVPKGEKDIIKAHAQNMGESTNEFIKRAIKITMEFDIDNG